MRRGTRKNPTKKSTIAPTTETSAQMNVWDFLSSVSVAVGAARERIITEDPESPAALPPLFWSNSRSPARVRMVTSSGESGGGGGTTYWSVMPSSIKDMTRNDYESGELNILPERLNQLGKNTLRTSL